MAFTSDKSFSGESTVFAENLDVLIWKVIVLLYPKKPENLIMATGTNDKNSVVDYIRQIWHRLGYVCATIGTLGVINYIK